MSVNWERIARDFDRSRCIVLLGPSLAKLPIEGKWVPVEELLATQITTILDQYQKEYDEESKSNLPYIAYEFLQIEKTDSLDLVDLVEDFYKEHEHKDIPEEYKRLAKLPIKLVINTTPDDFMEKAFKLADKRPIVRWYNYKGRDKPDSRSDHDIFEGSVDRPVVYNLFGSKDEPMSMVLTERHQLSLIRNLVQDNPPVPYSILSQFDRDKSYLFLGFDVENWQYRLILDIFNLEKGNRTLSPRINGKRPSNIIRAFYEDLFQFSFLEFEVEEFIQLLSQKLSGNKANKISNIYLSFDQQDIQELHELHQAFSAMEKRREVRVWHRDLLPPGESWEKVTTEVDTADIVLLLVSSNFISSKDPVVKEELEQILQNKEKENNVKLIPVLIRACDWSSYPGFQLLDPLPTNQKPVYDKHWTTKDEAYLHIVEEVRKIMRE